MPGRNPEPLVLDSDFLCATGLDYSELYGIFKEPYIIKYIQIYR
jgi:hypothetical protein